MKRERERERKRERERDGKAKDSLELRWWFGSVDHQRR